MAKDPEDEISRVREWMNRSAADLGDTLWRSTVGEHVARLFERQDTVSIDEVLQSITAERDAGGDMVKATNDAVILRLQRLKSTREGP